jgi:hypothetical protein
MSDHIKNLFYLEDLPDYEVAADYCDVSGWDVIDIDYRLVGKVSHLLVNKIAERVVYLDVEVDKTLIDESYDTFQVPASEGIHGFLNKEGDDHLIIPIGMVILDEEKKQVLVTQINYSTFMKARRFNRIAFIDPDYESVLYRHYIGDNSTEKLALDEKFYKRKEFENSLHRKITQ